MPGLKAVTRQLTLLVIVTSVLVPKIFSEPDWVKNVINQPIDLDKAEDAPAIILHNSSVTEIKSNGSNISSREKAVKVLSPDGVANTNLYISIDPSHEVNGLKGWRISPDGSKQDLKKEYTVITGFPSETGYYDDQSTLTASFPDVKTGDIVAYEYEYKEKSSWEGYYVSFVFQADLPVVSSYFELTIPEGWQTKLSSQNLGPITESHAMNKYVWQSGFLSYRPEEPYMPDWDMLRRSITVGCYYSDGVETKGFDNWNDVAKWADQKLGYHQIPDESISRSLAGIVETSSTTEKKLYDLAHWVQENIRYVAVELGAGRIQPRPAAVTLSNMFGDCKDKSTLLEAMLTAANIASRPALARVGNLVDEEFPSPVQFNHVILSIPLSEVETSTEYEQAIVDGWLYFDPTDPVTALGKLPTRLHGTRVLKIDSSEISLVKLPDLKPEQRQRVYFANAELFPNNSMTADVIIKDFGNKAAEARNYWNSTSEQDHSDSYKKVLGESIKNLSLKDFTRQFDADSAWITFTISGDQYLNEMGQLNLLKPNFFRPDRNNELTKDIRIHPVSFGSPEFVKYEISWKLPENYNLSEKIDSIAFSNDKASVNCFPDFESGILYYRSERVYSGNDFDTSEYKIARTFESELKAANRLRIFLTKPK